MPIYEIACQECCQINEVLVTDSNAQIVCPSCGGTRTEKLMSATSALTGRSGRQSHPGPGDTACCGSSPSTAGCAGPGSCCGKAG